MPKNKIAINKIMPCVKPTKYFQKVGLEFHLSLIVLCFCHGLAKLVNTCCYPPPPPPFILDISFKFTETVALSILKHDNQNL